MPTNSAAGTAVQGVVSKISNAVIVPVIEVIFGLAIVLFIWGAAGLIIYKDNPEKRHTSQMHILWGVIGMLIMISAYGIIRFVANSIGVASPF
jgi:tryptophan-rich sensory protein